MKAHIGVDADSGLVHTVVGTAANVNDVTQGHSLLHGQEEVVFADAGYQGAMKREEATGVRWQVAMRPGRRRALDKCDPIDALSEKIEKLKASVRAKVEHPFRVIKLPVRFHESALSGSCEEHGTDQDTVRVEQPVDGALANSAGSAGVSASAARPTG